MSLWGLKRQPRVLGRRQRIDSLVPDKEGVRPVYAFIVGFPVSVISSLVTCQALDLCCRQRGNVGFD